MTDAEPARRANPGGVEVLRCDACGAPVPLSAGDRIACAHCGHAVVPSAAHVALRDALSRDVETRAKAERLARELTAAGPVLQALGRFVKEGGYHLLSVVAAGVGAILAFFALMSLQSFGLSTLHVDVIDVLRDNEYMALFVGMIAVFVGGIPIIASFGLRTAEGRVRLLRSLAAKPPLHEGEPPGCRQCGAPLVAPEPGEITARCHYCAADNLVVVSADVLAAQISATAHVQAHMGSAAAEYRRQQVAVRRTLLKRAALVALPVVATYGLVSLEEKTGRPNWRDAIASDRLWSFQPAVRFGAQRPIMTYPCSLREPFSVLAALRHGETLRAVVSSPGSPPLMLLDTPQGKRSLLDETHTAQAIQVPHSGWFEILVQPTGCPLEHLGEQVSVQFDLR